MEHFWDLLFQLMKHGTNTLHVAFIFLFSILSSRSCIVTYSVETGQGELTVKRLRKQACNENKHIGLTIYCRLNRSNVHKWLFYEIFTQRVYCFLIGSIKVSVSTLNFIQLQLDHPVTRTSSYNHH